MESTLKTTTKNKEKDQTATAISEVSLTSPTSYDDISTGEAIVATEGVSNQSMPGDAQHAIIFRNLLIVVSLVLIVGSAMSELDLLPSVLLGCLILGINFYWTMLFVRKLLIIQKLNALDLLFYLTKFGISVVVLYVAIDHLELSPMGLLIGLSNIAFTAVVYSIITVIRPQNSP